MMMPYSKLFTIRLIVSPYHQLHPLGEESALQRRMNKHQEDWHPNFQPIRSSMDDSLYTFAVVIYIAHSCKW
jgi:hypothetical protein